MNTSKYRHELKFLCSEISLRMIEKRLKYLCPLDKNVGEDGKYIVRSLYFDTYNDRYFYENEAGVDGRNKYRIRLYNGNKNAVFLEAKESLHGLKRKETCCITTEQGNQLMKSLPVTNVREDQKLLKRFLMEKSMDLLEPKVIVEYSRTPYIFKTGNVRITFDRFIRSSFKVLEFLSPNISGRNILKEGMHVLEVKYDEGIPGAVKDMIIAEEQLQQISFSKYSLCRKIK